MWPYCSLVFLLSFFACCKGVTKLLNLKNEVTGRSYHYHSDTWVSDSTQSQENHWLWLKSIRKCSHLLQFCHFCYSYHFFSNFCKALLKFLFCGGGWHSVYHLLTSLSKCVFKTHEGSLWPWVDYVTTLVLCEVMYQFFVAMTSFPFSTEPIWNYLCHI